MPPAFDHATAAFRTLARHKRFSALAVISLGVAIALNTTMYSVLDTLISPKIEMREPERLWQIEFFGDYRGMIPINELNSAIRDAATFHEGVTGVMRAQETQLVERGSR